MENRLDLVPYVVVFIRHRMAILINFVIIAIVAVIFAFVFLQKQYKAEISFLPLLGESSLEGMIPNILLSNGSSSDIMTEQIPKIFEGKAYKRKIIDKFGLYEHYKLSKNINKFEFAVRALSKDLILTSEEKGSMTISKTISFTLTAFHSSADTAFQMANFAYEVLDSTVRAISTDRGHRSRIFVENQLVLSKLKLDSMQKVMQDFQVENKAYNIPEQAKMSISEYADLKAALQLNELRMQSIKKEFAVETPEFNALQQTTDAYKTRLSQLETREKPDAMPSLKGAIKLLPQYSNLMRDLEVQNQVILLLTRELEQAKIKEGKNVSSLFIIDPAFVPAYKSRPKRITVILVWITAYMGFIFLYTLLFEVYRIRLKNSRIIISLKEAFSNKIRK